MAQPAEVVTPALAHRSRGALTLSQRWWGLDWAPHLPWRFDDVVVELGSTEEVLAFVRDHYAAIFDIEGDSPRFFADPMTDAKLKFSQEMDMFAFRHDGACIGVLLAHASDWSTYYMRSGGFLPAYKGRQLLGRCFERMFAPLRDAGVVRVDADTAPSNHACVRMLTRLGFNTTGMVNTERWGALLRMTKFLHEDALHAFHDRFCLGALDVLPGAGERRK